jgi:ribosome production factor 2
VDSAFTDPQRIEHLCELNDTALFCYTSDTKKRPMNLVLGSLFDNKMLDMFEYEVTNFIPIEYFQTQIEIDSFLKPILIFQGDLFETDFEFDRIKRYFIDFFKLQDVEQIEITELRRVIVISIADDKEIKLRMYQVNKFNEYNVYHT